MKDIFGIEVKPGDFILKSLSNRRYTLYRVLRIKNSLKVERIRRDYERQGWGWTYRKIISYVSKKMFLIVQPPLEVVYLFDKNGYDKSDEPLFEQFNIQ